MIKGLVCPRCGGVLYLRQNTREGGYIIFCGAHLCAFYLPGEFDGVF